MKNILVLGSGRSGTSMITGCLAGAGYFCGDNYLGKNNSNPKGFFEDYEVNQINEAILDRYHYNIPERVRRVLFPAYPFYNARWLARVPLTKKITCSPEIETHILRVIRHTPFCYKDPRFSYTLPAWIPLLPADTAFVCVFRHPRDTAMSIVKECRNSPALTPLRMSKQIALNVWDKMHQHILKNYKRSEHKEQWFFIHFDQVLNGTRLSALADFLHANVDLSFPEKKYNRTRTLRQETFVPIKSLQLYEQFCDFAGIVANTV